MSGLIKIKRISFELDKTEFLKQLRKDVTIYCSVHPNCFGVNHQWLNTMYNLKLNKVSFSILTAELGLKIRYGSFWDINDIADLKLD